jgi:hypothetical protein
MALGIPFIKFQYKSVLAEPLIPDFHYISVERPPDLWLDRNGTKGHAALIEARFLQVRNDDDFLRFVAMNARDYYARRLAPHVAVPRTMELLGIEEAWAASKNTLTSMSSERKTP